MVVEGYEERGRRIDGQREEEGGEYPYGRSRGGKFAALGRGGRGGMLRGLGWGGRGGGLGGRG